MVALAVVVRMGSEGLQADACDVRRGTEEGLNLSVTTSKSLRG
jgi:hypothetical protein